jgi:1-acyl-sn-glycerol-3-phosphate acyltransferase
MSEHKHKPFPLWMSACLSIFFWIELVGFCIFFNGLGFIVFIPLRIFSKRKASLVLHNLACAWAKAIFTFSPFWRLKVSGARYLDPEKNYVFVSNHQSLVDILAALAGIPNHFKFIAKKELFSIPFLGWHMFLAGYIALDRTSSESGKKTILTARQWLKQGVSVLFFPEGTRSLDGQIHEFKPGAFKIAEDLEIAVVPVVIEGTLEAIPKKTWMIREPSRIRLNIGKPILISESGDSRSAAEVRSGIRTEMIARLAKIRSTRS